MNKILPAIAGVLLSAIFLLGSVPFLLNMKMPEPPALPPDAITFMTLFSSTGYLKMVKIFELIGALLVIVPYTRNLGLLVLGPVIVNILTYTMLIGGGIKSLNNPMSIIMTGLMIILPLYLMWVERKAWAGLVKRG